MLATILKRALGIGLLLVAITLSSFLEEAFLPKASAQSVYCCIEGRYTSIDELFYCCYPGRNCLPCIEVTPN